MWKKWQISPSSALQSLWMVTAAMKLEDDCFLAGKAMRNLDSNDITLLTKVHIVKAMVFPIVIYGCESWTIKKAECQRIDVFELWCWRLLRYPWTARRWYQSILKEINPAFSLEGLMLMLKLMLQCFSHLIQTADSLEKTLMLGEIEAEGKQGDRGWNSWIASLIQWILTWANSGRWWWTGNGAPKSWTWLDDWTATHSQTIKCTIGWVRWGEVWF